MLSIILSTLASPPVNGFPDKPKLNLPAVVTLNDMVRIIASLAKPQLLPTNPQSYLPLLLLNGWASPPLNSNRSETPLTEDETVGDKQYVPSSSEAEDKVVPNLPFFVSTVCVSTGLSK